MTVCCFFPPFLTDTNPESLETSHGYLAACASGSSLSRLHASVSSSRVGDLVQEFMGTRLPSARLRSESRYSSQTTCRS